MSENQKKTELTEEDLENAAGGGFPDYEHIKIPAPQNIIFVCTTCGNLTSVGHIFYQQGELIPKMCPCGGHYTEKYHCPMCGSTYVDFNGNHYFCNNCQKESMPDGTLIREYS
jgi:hypothetical protein